MISNGHLAGAAAVPAGDGTMQIAFIGSIVQVDLSGNPISSPPPLPYQHLYLNVLGVRLNPNAAAGENDSNWVTIPAPVLKGIGNKAGSSQVTIDLTQIGQLATFFSNAFVKANAKNQSYSAVELLLNSANPGTIVPLCSALASPGEGCTAYPITFPSLTPTAPVSIKTTLGSGQGLTVAKKAVLPLVISITVDVPSPPAVTGNQVMVDLPTIDVIPNVTVVPTPSSTASPKATPSPITLNPYMALVSGKVTSGNGTKTVINVEPAGTSNLVSPVNPFNVANGSYSLYLPAAPGGTTFYDFYASAPARSFAIASDIGVQPSIQNSPLNFTLASHPLQAVKGSLTDACNGLVPPGLQNATIKILEPFISPTPTPGKGSPTPSASPTPDCSLVPATGCVVVATAVTDSSGAFPTPVPGNGNGLPAFSSIPVVQGLDYTLIVDAPGFDRTVIPLVKPKNSSILSCVGTHDTKDKSVCDLALSHGYLNGSLSLGAVTPTSLTAQVVAEDTGTNELENTLNVTVPAGQSGANFPPPGLYIPDQTDPRYSDGLLTGIDLYALVDDQLNGVTQTNTGHSIPVEADLPVPEACATAAVEASLADTTCVGHGSIDGSLSDATTGTTVVLEKPDPVTSKLVQLISGPAGPYGDENGSGYALCAPADDYVLQRFDNGVPGASTPVALASPTLSPAAGATPCPGICDAGQGTSCLVCTNTAGPAL